MLKIVIALVVFAFCAAAAVKEQSERDSRFYECIDIVIGLLIVWAVMIWPF